MEEKNKEKTKSKMVVNPPPQSRIHLYLTTPLMQQKKSRTIHPKPGAEERRGPQEVEGLGEAPKM